MINHRKISNSIMARILLMEEVQDSVIQGSPPLEDRTMKASGNSTTTPKHLRIKSL